MVQPRWQPDNNELPFEVPLEELPATARRILEAAKHLLENDGYEALTLSRIAEEAGEHKASIGYYFGNKAGLVRALADYAMHDASAEALKTMSDMPVGEKRVRATMRFHRRITIDAYDTPVFFDILPHALRDPEIKERLRRQYVTWREAAVKEVAGELDEETHARVAPIGALLNAVVDGMAIQLALGRDDVDVDAVFHYVEELLVAMYKNDWRA